MEINLTHGVERPYEMFGISNERSEVILDHIASVCEAAYLGFPEAFCVHAIMSDGRLGHRVDDASMLKEMVQIAVVEKEKNYILYIAGTGIERVNYLLFGNKNRVTDEDEQADI